MTTSEIKEFFRGQTIFLTGGTGFLGKLLIEKLLRESPRRAINLSLRSTMTKSEIREFFKGQTIFLTGGTGFLGKLLIEKLLRECFHLEKIYILIRPKKGKTTNQRFQELFDYACFDLLKSKEINYTEKVSLINGNCEEPFLGLSESDQKLLKSEVTCVIHAAANVKFEQTLKEATCNVRATRDLLELAKEMPKLKAFVHVSTAYSNCIHNIIKEKFYDPPIKARSLFSLVETLDEDSLQAITPHVLGKWPNTYVYTKCVTEDLIRTAGKDLPFAIVRPAIVTSTSEEPMPGWIDNFYGVGGIVAAAALGVIRSFHARLDGTAYGVPVDYVTNNILAAAWNIQYENQKIYNFIGHKNNLVTWAKLMEVVETFCWEAATEKVVWYYCFKLRENKLWHQICVFFLHTAQAYIVDAILFCIRRPPIAVKNYRRLNKLLDMISYFSVGEWYFDNDNVTNLWEKMGPEDKRLFKFDMEHVNFEKYVHDAVWGARLYLLKETPDTIPKGNRKVKILFVAHYTVVALFWYLVYKLIMFLLSFFF